MKTNDIFLQETNPDVDMLISVFTPYALDQGASREQAFEMATEAENEASQQFLSDVEHS